MFLNKIKTAGLFAVAISGLTAGVCVWEMRSNRAGPAGPDGRTAAAFGPDVRDGDAEAQGVPSLLPVKRGHSRPPKSNTRGVK